MYESYRDKSLSFPETEPANQELSDEKLSQALSEAEAEFDALERERAFHQQRWEQRAREGRLSDRIAAARNSRLAITPELIMQVEAERDNADFDRRQTEEFEKWEAMSQRVIASFIEKLQNPEAPKKTLVLCLGGGMKASYLAGEVFAMADIGITPDIIIGASSGSEVATAFAQGPTGVRQGIHKILDGLSSQEFINFGARAILERNMINLDHNQKLSDDPSGPFYINKNAVAQSPSELHYIVTNAAGEPTFIDAKKLEAPSDGIRASMTIPHVTGDLKTLDGQQYYDGAINPMPIEEVLQRFPDVTDVLILPQDPFTRPDQIELTTLEKFGAYAAKHHGYTLVEKGFLMKKALRESFDRISQEKNVNIGVIWPPDEDLSQIGTDSNQALAAVISSARATYQKFGMEPPANMLDTLALER